MHIALQVLTTAQALDKAAVRVFKPHGVTPAQFNVLSLLSDQPQGMCASDIAHALIVDPSNVTGLVKRMKKDGLVVELENAADRRQRIVGLSPQGRRIWEAASRDYERCLAALDAPLTRAAVAGAEKLLQQIVVCAASLP
jgi:DNA-binding MarR family transcriptional regulator